MNNSIRLFSIRGIDLRLHITFPLILLWAAIQFGLLAGELSSAFFGVVAVSILFVLVTLHELGHSFAAQHYGIEVKRIVLTPIGGVAQLGDIPDKPVQELVIAIAGPAVNLIIAVLMGLAVFGLGINLTDSLLSLGNMSGFSFSTLFAYIFVSNIFLALFNLLPAIPMDGGRVLRALLALKLDYVQATTIATAVGRMVAGLMGRYGLYSGNFFLILIAMFVFLTGRQETKYVKMRSLLRGYRVQDVYSASAYRLGPDSTIQQAMNMMIFGGQGDFPIVEGDRLLGFLSRRELISASRTAVGHTMASAFMRRDIAPVSSDDDLFEVQRRLIAEQMDALPVVIGDRYLGLITWQNIANLQDLFTSSPNIIPHNQSA